jgi:hypothetical protein
MARIGEVYQVIESVKFLKIWRGRPQIIHCASLVEFGTEWIGHAGAMSNRKI